MPRDAALCLAIRELEVGCPGPALDLILSRLMRALEDDRGRPRCEDLRVLQLLGDARALSTARSTPLLGLDPEAR